MTLSLFVITMLSLTALLGAGLCAYQSLSRRIEALFALVLKFRDEDEKAAAQLYERVKEVRDELQALPRPASLANRALLAGRPDSSPPPAKRPEPPAA